MIKTALISLLLTVCLIPINASSPDSTDETLDYKVIYRWGLVNKQAGRATFMLHNKLGGQSRAEMYARTEPWADHIYSVRDTLISTFTTSTRLPVCYRRIAHEGGRFANDCVEFKISGKTTTAHCTRIRKGKKDKTATVTETDLSADGAAVDLLSSFYYLRALDFDKMKKGTVKTINIFSGKRKEILTITYDGITEIKHDGKRCQTHKVTFTFTSGQGKTTSHPIRAWLSTTGRRIPLKLEGELSIGKVQCIYTGS